MQHTIREEIRGVFIFVAVMWSVFLADYVVPIDFNTWGIVPRTLRGIVGVPLAPFLHGGWGHILGNTVPLIVLLVLLAGSRTRTWPTVVEIIALGGGLLWLLGGSNTVHVGASGLVYGLITFLIVSGFREKRLVPMLVAILVAFLYGSTLLFGVLPTAGTGVSWDGHLYSALAGAALGYFTVDTDKDQVAKSTSLG